MTITEQVMQLVTVDFIQDTTLERKLPKDDNFVLKGKEYTDDTNESITY